MRVLEIQIILFLFFIVFSREAKIVVGCVYGGVVECKQMGWGYATCGSCWYLDQLQFKINLIFSSYFGKFIIFLLMERTKKKNQWSIEEIQLLCRLYPQFPSKKWKRISQFFTQQGFSRSQIQCRQKWINFLDPSINKKQWQEWQLQKLYEIHQQVGTRWCIVQKYIGRTQNKIKNRFYGTLRNYIRFVVNQFDLTETCYNYQISKLSPKFLNDMYSAQQQFSFLNEQIKQMIYAMHFKIDKKMLEQRVREYRTIYQQLNGLIFQAFNQQPQTANKRKTKTESQNNGPTSLSMQYQQQFEVEVEQQYNPTNTSPLLPSLSNSSLFLPQYHYPFLLPYQPSMFYWFA